MFGDNTIKLRVMKVIEQKVKSAQSEYNKGVLALEQELIEKKAVLADNLVEGLIGKLL